MSESPRELAAMRAGFRCERCGAHRGITAGHAHHRKLRSQGGEDCPSNLVWCCGSCHTFAHANVALAREQGWIVPSWGDPREVPIHLRDGIWLLRPSGAGERLADLPSPLHTAGRAIYIPRKGPDA